MSREKLVRDTAYEIWEAEGRPEGRDSEHWRLAEERVGRGDAEQGKSKTATVPKGRSKKETADKPAAAKGRTKKAV
ncbi:hypothetical protein ASE66_29415 [Bosea sp. Root483D1]|jgi:hypothetical protein|uniref:DUF2934 domain-containing protein n=1 Tax=Bosea sp. Root483D1 TaxID=1736544 RepID=UPI00070F5657|nr:DUF2934 domain-containing protein [Bosea sp. Root483D1]KRE17584.1 hypothetical protein ASE66_29415 [Bosea sp. Root483D1]